MTWPPILIAAGSLLVAVVALAAGLARRRGEDTAGLADRLARLEVKVEVFWRGVAFDAARLLHSPHPQWERRDQLLEAFMSDRLSLEDAPELRRLMRDVVESAGDDGQRMAASVVLRYLSLWLAERGVPEDI